MLSILKSHGQKKLPLGDFFVTIARKIVHFKLYFRKGA